MIQKAWYRHWHAPWGEKNKSKKPTIQWGKKGPLGIDKVLSRGFSPIPPLFNEEKSVDVANGAEKGGMSWLLGCDQNFKGYIKENSPQ